MTTTADWWPDGEAPYVLIDNHEDGLVNEYCFVPARVIEGDEYAELRARGGLEAAALAFIASQEEQVGIDGGLDDYSFTWPGDRLVLTDRRRWERPAARQTTSDDWIDPEGRVYEACPWMVCEPGDEGAVEFCVLSAVPAEEHPGGGGS